MIPDIWRGWGMLQIPGAVEAALHPLAVGMVAIDSLRGQDGRLVMARRIALLPGASGRITALPSADLDICLEIHNSSWLIDPQQARPPYRIDTGGNGAVESGILEGYQTGIPFVVVKRLSGSGEVDLTLANVAEQDQTAFSQTLGGEVQGWANGGHLAGTPGYTVVLSSLADIDPFARMVHALDPTGQQRPGWPATLFLPGYLQGPLTAPLVWNLDGNAGDEIVVASTFGRVYYFDAHGEYTEHILAAANISLTAPVCLEDGDGQRLVVVVGSNGTLYRLTGEGILLDSLPLGSGSTLAPAVGQLTSAAGEELVIVSATGTVYGLDAEGNTLPGWPVALGGAACCPPVLADLDGDALHEVIVPRLSPAATEVIFSVRNGDGSAAVGNGTAGGIPGGGEWMTLSDPAVADFVEGGGLQVVVSGLGREGAVGDSLTWSFLTVRLSSNGGVAVTPLPGFSLPVVTTNGDLQLLWRHLPAPLAWDYHLGGGTELECLLAVGWEEEIAGYPDLEGATNAYFRADQGETPLASRSLLWRSEPANPSLSEVGSGLYPAGDEGWIRLTWRGRDVVAQAAPYRWHSALPWGAERGDSRNSGAYPLAAGPPTDVHSESVPPAAALSLWPNPSRGLVRVRWAGMPPGKVTLNIYDLRGRRLRTLLAPSGEPAGEILWDGRDELKRPVATGTYLFVLNGTGKTLRGRTLLTR
jgi:hypothetical protein